MMRRSMITNRRAVRLEWLGEGLRFKGGGTEPPSPDIILDADSEEGPSPMLALLLAAGGCSGADVVHILGKMREPATEVSIEVSGLRRDDHPRRFTDIHFVFHIRGGDVDRDKAEHAVELSVTKYCSVIHSLAPDVTVTYDVECA